ncbi:MAG: polyprenyl synthetase family protein [Niameybacter sp.]|uniref:polyprenyl synthetase family protein n=1 Tax=Niameybacter sp. TaxID=2033640 RepID=UPI002FC9821F
MNSKLECYREQIEKQLESALPTNSAKFGVLYDAMRYSLYAGGKRIRPILMKLSFEAVGGEGDIAPYLCAIEMIHTYSLIHDDLPAMDNDDLRRGKLTNHKVFGEATAILAGDALLNEAFTWMLQDALEHDDMRRVQAAHTLAEASGSEGMIGGQILDMQSENKVITLEELQAIHVHKTGALIAAAVKMGALLGGGSPEEVTALTFYGKYLGQVFQIVDDVLDKTSTNEELGKPVKSDVKNNKNTYLSFYDVDTCYQIAEDLTVKAIKCLERVQGDTTLLEQLATRLVHRKN